MRQPLALFAVLLLAALGTAQAAQLTIYNNGPAVISQQRSVQLTSGRQTLEWPGVAQRILPQTVWLQGAGVTLAGSRYSAKAISRDHIISRFVGDSVTLLRDDGKGGDVTRKATLLSAGATPMVRVDGHVEMLGAHSPWRIAFKQSAVGPGGLALDVKVGSSGKHPLQLIYQTSGLNWTTQYVGRYNDADKTLDLVARANISNNSGMDFDHAGVSLIAGTVHRARRSAPRPVLMRSMAAKSTADGVPAQPAFAYYRYQLPDRLTLTDGQTSSATLFRASDIHVKRRYVIEGGWYGSPNNQMTHAVIRLRFANKQGKPMPAGNVRIYGAGDHPLLLGEDSIGNTPEQGDVSLTLGRAFDITAKRKVSDQSRQGSKHESRRSVTVHNASDDAVKVRVKESLPGDWTIKSQNLPHNKVDAQHAVWIVGVPAHGKAALHYTVQWH